MGMDRSDYIIIGCDISNYLNTMSEEEKDDFDEKYFRRTCDIGDVVHLPDNYSGKYDFFGIVLDFDPDGFEGLKPFIYREKDYSEQHAKISKVIQDEFGEILEPNLIVLTHWT
ncbi:hypothetical protein NBRC13296_12655 [Paenibacillus chitinolyticus]|uniref:hypothetical protein n=1 Tax=Paenibacillus chitinolyticus TaxID=79263 RepID=UPI003558461B